MKYYAVKNGFHPGIYESWDDCKKEVNGFKGAVFKSFSSLEEAKAFLGVTSEPKKNKIEGLVAFVDGSFNVKTSTYGYGVVLIDHNKVIKELYGSGNHQDFVSMRNVSGEIFGSEVAINYAINNNYKDIHIFYDYEGIEKWATGVWKTNKPGTIRYASVMQEFSKKIKIHFHKVTAHTGVKYNERADYLAKKAVGIE